LTNQEKKRTQIRDEREVKTDIPEIQKILRDYNEQLYVNKVDNLEEMDKFLETYNLSRLNMKKYEF